jgi:hypothetical protein
MYSALSGLIYFMPDLISFVCANEGKVVIRKRNKNTAFMRLAYGSGIVIVTIERMEPSFKK